MWLERGTPPLIAMLLAAVLLAGCAASLGSGNASGGVNAIGSSEQVASVAAPPQRQQAPKTDRRVAQASSPSISDATPGVYRIGPMDVLDISVFKVPELSKTVQVAETGTINLPLVGEIPAAGKTAQQLERDLTAKLGATYLQNPQVTVLVKENNSQRVTIEGAVEKPGVYPLKGKTSLLELVAMAGSLTPNSDSTVLVLRKTGGKRSAAKFDVAAIRRGKADDPTLQAGDIVVAGTSAIRAGFNNVLKALPLAGVFALF